MLAVHYGWRYCRTESAAEVVAGWDSEYYLAYNTVNCDRQLENLARDQAGSLVATADCWWTPLMEEDLAPSTCSNQGVRWKSGHIAARNTLTTATHTNGCGVIETNKSGTYCAGLDWTCCSAAARDDPGFLASRKNMPRFRFGGASRSIACLGDTNELTKSTLDACDWGSDRYVARLAWRECNVAFWMSLSAEAVLWIHPGNG